ncbi:MAG: hypothetical protein L0Y72_04765 [Gemmataceae bacterium]|nr:hypothetical protein [Gemmataceae bacterium]MCI0738333.1 hypothetical protein [Gemmataceae bacterium]
MSAAFFPENWLHVLEEMERALAEAVRAASAREAEPAPTTVDNERLGWAAVNSELPRRQAQASLEELDRVFENEEISIRNQVAGVAELRRRLADWRARVS